MVEKEGKVSVVMLEIKHLTSCCGAQIHAPLHRHPNIDRLLVEAAAALTYPAVISQKLSSFLHLLQYLLPVLLSVRHRRPSLLPLIT